MLPAARWSVVAEQSKLATAGEREDATLLHLNVYMRVVTRDKAVILSSAIWEKSDPAQSSVACLHPITALKFDSVHVENNHA